MTAYETIKALARATKKWREDSIECLRDVGCTDLAYRPTTGMSSFGWVLAHQAAVYDFTLNVLILGKQPKNPTIYQNYVPGTSGDWDGTPLIEIQRYYERAEYRFLEWTLNATISDYDRKIKGDQIPDFFKGMNVREVIANMFCHLNKHNGHLDVLTRDWEQENEA